MRTWTLKLQSDSPALEAADNALAAALLFDQRGSLPIDDGHGGTVVGLDSGALELSEVEYFEGLGA